MQKFLSINSENNELFLYLKAYVRNDINTLTYAVFNPVNDAQDITRFIVNSIF